jgi:hypothetical protein
VTPPKGGAAAPSSAAASGASQKRDPLLEPNPSRYLTVIAIEARQDLEADELELASIYSGEALGELSSRKLLSKREPGKLRLRGVGSYVASTEAVSEQERRCSFVLDCDAAPVLSLLDQLRQRAPAPTVNDVTALVSAHISDKSYARGFDIASVVARRHEGDCTEHAVLLAALLRGIGIPSHVVLGIALIDLDDRLMAFGHAWVEYHDGRAWQLADAANPGEERRRIRYLPVRQLREEGPAYARALFTGLQLTDIQAIGVPAH